MLGVDDQTIQRLARRGELEGVLINRRLGYRFSAEAVERFLAKHRTKGAIGRQLVAGSERETAT